MLQLLLQRGPLARGDIAADLSLNHGSVSRIIEPLLREGIVRETTQQISGGGRPRVPVAINPASRYAAGVHLGLQRTTVGLTDLAGQCVAVCAEDRDPADAAATLRRAAELTDDLVASAPGPVLGVGVVTGGEVDRARGRIVRNDALGWGDIDVADPLHAQTGLDVVVDNNVRAHLGAETAFGAGAGMSSVLYLFIGNIAEMGFVNQAAAMNPDSVIQGSVERIVVPTLTGDGLMSLGECGTDTALLAAARGARLAVTSLGDLIRLADQDEDAAAVRLFERRSTQVARVADTLYDLMQPHLVILGGSGAPSERWLDDVRERVEAVPPDRIVRPGSGGTPLVTAAAGLVIRAFLAAGTTTDAEVSG
ncbi:transcriptional regulator, ROK family protein [Kibdelosporangium phytohabitans]|uniref:Transcriptional regulator, ROK family protein n=1 Tax=Kibdelosporangium phytohabitans TaxID=860235 RepID=A0A0N9IJ72_9PSEU|nr:transcriptional regulator, ROK family protein [Kibdelosporangium phytohabitans]